MGTRRLTLFVILLAHLAAHAQVYPYFSPGGALSGNATSQNVNLAAGTPFIAGTLPTARLPAFSGDCTTPGGSGVLTCTQINGVTPGGSCTNQAVTSISASAVPTCSTLTSSFVNNTIALTGVDINTSNQVIATHLAAALPVTQGGTGIATLTGLALGNGTSAFSAYGGTGCNNQFPRSLSATGTATCATVSLTTDVINTLPVANGGTGTASTLTGLVRGSATAMTAAELSGDVTTTGSNATTIANNAVTNAKLAQMSANTVKCNNTAGSANAIDCTIAQTQSLLSIPGLLDVQTFNGNGTWTKPAGSPLITRAVCLGAGGGGGSGAQVVLGTAESGGAAGGGGSAIDILLTTSALGATETVTVGTGGTGGAATGGVGSGNPGAQGGTSSFGAWAKAWGGGGGSQGASAVNAGGGGGAGAGASGASASGATGGTAGSTNGTNGGSGATATNVNSGYGGSGGGGDSVSTQGGNGGANWGYGGPGGGAGGGLSATTPTAGGNGGAVPTNTIPPGGGAATGANGTNGSTSAAGYVAGSAGGGGGANSAGTGGTGGNGGRAAGGGGGGASAGGASGAGGSGGNGLCVAITSF